MKRAQQQQVLEWSFTSEQIHADPFNAVELDVLFTQPDGKELLLPTFWAGDQTWKVRYSSSQLGVHRYQSRCSAAGDTGLHGQTGTLEILPYTGENTLLKHGPLHHATSRREVLAAGWVDPYSSALWFDGWKAAIRTDAPWLRALARAGCPTAAPRTWLLSVGWRRGGGRIDVDDVPGPAP